MRKRKLLIALVVLTVLLVAADRIGVAVAENQTSDRVTPVSASTSRTSLPLSAYSRRLRMLVPLSTLALHLHLTSVHVTPGGLQIGAAARNVQFARA